MKTRGTIARMTVDALRDRPLRSRVDRHPLTEEMSFPHASAAGGYCCSTVYPFALSIATSPSGLAGLPSTRTTFNRAPSRARSTGGTLPIRNRFLSGGLGGTEGTGGGGPTNIFLSGVHVRDWSNENCSRCGQRARGSRCPRRVRYTAGSDRAGCCPRSIATERYAW